MSWDVEYTDEFAVWWQALTENQQEDVTAVTMHLTEKGPQLPFPYSSGIAGARHAHMRELRVQSSGKPLRVFYALTRCATRFCSLAATKPATSAFTNV